MRNYATALNGPTLPFPPQPMIWSFGLGSIPSRRARRDCGTARSGRCGSEQDSAIAARLQSDQDAEALTAGRMLVRALDKHGLRIGDVVAIALRPAALRSPQSGARMDPMRASSPHHRGAQECMGWPDGVITEWERQFVGSLLHRTKISPRQREVLADIVSKVRRHATKEAA